MSEGGSSEWMVVTRGAKTLPIVEILTGRGFITGKSGSGKSNTASVIAEQLLENNYNLLIIDTEGEYFGLKEKYQLLHVGGDDFADVQVTPTHAEKIAEIALQKNVPIILDVSGFDDVEAGEELIHAVVSELYDLEKSVRKPFLVMVEEMQEYLPQQGGATELAELLERVAKRGRKRGLGICGISQRPSSVDKDFITQCDWMVWHRLNWETDLNVVRQIIGSDKAGSIEDFDPGEAFLMTDWDDSIERVQFKQKETHDAGATPGLEEYERPDLKEVGDQLITEIKGDHSQTESITDLPDSDNGSSSPDSTTEDAALSRSPVNDSGGTVSQLDTAPSQDDPGEFPEQEFTEADLSDIDDVPEAELRERLRETHREKQILEDELGELRSMLESLDESPTTRTSARESETPDESELEARAEAIAQRSRQSQATELSAPSRPVPPEEPTDRDGVAGTLLEIGGMAVYFFKSLRYRGQLLRYRVKRRRQ